MKHLIYDILEWLDYDILGCRWYALCNWLLYGDFWADVRGMRYSTPNELKEWGDRAFDHTADRADRDPTAEEFEAFRAWIEDDSIWERDE